MKNKPSYELIFTYLQFHAYYKRPEFIHANDIFLEHFSPIELFMADGPFISEIRNTCIKNGH